MWLKESNEDETEKFNFENEKACLMYFLGEVHIIEYGEDKILHSCQTYSTSPFLTSLVIDQHHKTRINYLNNNTNKEEGITTQEQQQQQHVKYEEDIKVFAYMMDLQTIQITDLNRNTNVATIAHTSKIDWMVN